MKYKVLFVSALLAVTLTGCGKEKEAKKDIEISTVETTVATETTEATTETAEPVAKIVGTEAEGSSIFKMEIINNSGKEIKGISIKSANEEEYPASMMKSGETIKPDEDFTLYFDSSSAPKLEVKNSAGQVKPTKIFHMQIEFTDNTTSVIHEFPFGDTETCVLNFEEEQAYLIYSSYTQGKDVNSKEFEAGYVEKTYKTADSSQQTDTAFEETQPVTQKKVQQNNETPTEKPQQQAEAPKPVTAAPTEKPTEAPTEKPTEAPTEAPTAADPNDGCGGDFLFN